MQTLASFITTPWKSTSTDLRAQPKPPSCGFDVGQNEGMKAKEIFLLVPTFFIIPSIQVTPALATIFAFESFPLVTTLIGIYSFVSAFFTMIVAVAITKKRSKKTLYLLFGCTITAWVAIYAIIEWIRHWGFVAELVWFTSASAGALIVLLHNLKETNQSKQTSLTTVEAPPHSSWAFSVYEKKGKTKSSDHKKRRKIPTLGSHLLRNNVSRLFHLV